MPRQTTSINPEEIKHFSALADQWWLPNGPLKSLHDLNPLRLLFIEKLVKTQQVVGSTGSATNRHRNDINKPLAGLNILDVGCGGGILAEGMAKLGAHVTGIDASFEACEAAKAHAKQSGLSIHYINQTVEACADQGLSFDCVTAFEVIEHVSNRPLFWASVEKVLRPGGCVAMATVNRTVKSYLLAIVAAEYVLGWIPPGTHDWESFVKPSETVAELSNAGLSVCDMTGVVFDPLKKQFKTSAHRLDVNYMLAATKASIACASR